MKAVERSCGTCAHWNEILVTLNAVRGLCCAEPPAAYRRTFKPDTEEHDGADCPAHKLRERPR